MIYITTGANGAGKTLVTLKRVRDLSVKDNRPVYYSGINLTPEGLSFGWIERDPKEWESFPDGSIILVDECQDHFPAIPIAAKRLPFITQLAKHRHRGFDFFFITPHPTLMDPFIRKLVANPGWHRHMKRQVGAALLSQLEWSYVKDAPEKSGASKDGTVTLVPYPKEVYGWYTSTVLNTAKVRIPKQVYVLAGCLVVIPIMFYSVYSIMRNKYVEQPKAKAAAAAPAAINPTGSSSSPPSAAKPVMTTAEYVSQMTPRLVGFQHTAPRYDQLTQPTQAPYPAACVTNGKRCSCWTQQGTILEVPKSLCHDIVQRGFFVDWQQPAQAQPTESRQSAPQQQQQQLPQHSSVGLLPDQIPTNQPQGPDRSQAAIVDLVKGATQAAAARAM